MKPIKRLLVPSRLRRLPDSGWSWVDRRFVQDYAEGLSRDAVSLYFFLAAVSDRQGLSYWGDTATAARLKIEPGGLAPARQQLLGRDLIAYQTPLTQVLSLPPSPLRRGTDAVSLGEVLRRLTHGTGDQTG